MMALVFGEIAASMRLASMLWVARSTSTNTGTAPNWRIGLTVVGKPAATPMTSSPGLMARSPRREEVSVEKATRLADEPELTVIRCFTPRNFARRSSNIALKRPVVSQPSRLASTISCNSLVPITLPDTGHGALAGHEGLGRVHDLRVLLHERRDLAAQLVGRLLDEMDGSLGHGVREFESFV